MDGTAKGRKLGRGIVMLGEHALRDALPADSRGDALAYRAPALANLPLAILSPFIGMTLARIGNTAIHTRYKSTADADALVPASAYFYVLDAAANWNRLYGNEGFLEYQVLVPESQALTFIRMVLERLVAASLPSFLTSMKLMGPGNEAPMSFPRPGVAFSVNLSAAGTDIFAILDDFDEMLTNCGGRVYLGKDARARAAAIDGFYPRRLEWARLIARTDPQGRLSSGMARRLGLRTT